MNARKNIVTLENVPRILQLASVTIGLVHVMFFVLMLVGKAGFVSYYNIISILIYVLCFFFARKEENIQFVYTLYVGEILTFSVVMNFALSVDCWYQDITVALIPCGGLIFYLAKKHTKRSRNNFYVFWVVIAIVFIVNLIKTIFFGDIGFTEVLPGFEKIIALSCALVQMLSLTVVSLAFFAIAMGETQKKDDEYRQLTINLVNSLSSTVDAKDRYTSGHSARVAKYSKMLAEKMGISGEELDDIYYAGLLHDVGKIRIPDGIINKPGKLTDEEFGYIKLHPVTGYHILRGVYENSVIAMGARHHHERYDGKGYPNGLIGKAIPEVARIIGIADSYDAMSSNRSYRKALPQAVVREEIEKNLGTQFDPAIGKLMLEIIDADTEYKLCQGEERSVSILVIDEDLINRKLVQRFLADEPMYQVLSASNGYEAIDIMLHERVDLVLLDVTIASTDGMSALEEMRHFSEAPVVFITADKSMDTIKKAEECGAADYLMKPISAMSLKEIIHSVLKK